MAKLDCINKSFVDVGSHFAYYAIQSLREGGYTALAIDKNKKRLGVAKKLAEHFEVPTMFFTASYDFNKVKEILPSNEKFDIVWCIGLLHYLNDKKKFIDEVVSKCKEVFIVEVFTQPANAKSLSKHYDPEILDYIKSKFMESMELAIE
jgi:2-polyprenyl-3-methyl-5-hydroxy-6-metoxy-1,4-benzoquinol methylase